MNNAAEKFIKIAEAEIGYIEKASSRSLFDKKANAGKGNYTKYGAWYPMQAQPWCAVFVSWCAETALIGADIIPKHASCSAGVRFFKKIGAWHEADGAPPWPGDIIYFTRDGKTPVHTGIVCAADEKELLTIEGKHAAKAGLCENGGCVAKNR
jgi:hypothetical protein